MLILYKFFEQEQFDDLLEVYSEQGMSIHRKGGEYWVDINDVNWNVFGSYHLAVSDIRIKNFQFLGEVKPKRMFFIKSSHSEKYEAYFVMT